MERGTVQLEHGPLIKGWFHAKNECLLPASCTIHVHSQHHMRAFPQHWRDDRGMMERICTHGIGHPDPDQVAYWKSLYEGREVYALSIHGCDGCCARPPR